MVRTLAGAVILHPVVPDAVMGQLVPDAVTGLGPADAPVISAAGRVSGAIPHALVAGSLAVAAVPAVRVHITAAVAVDIGVELVRFPRPFIHIVAECLGLDCLLVSLLAQPGCVHLGLLCIRFGTRRFRFTLPGVKFLRLGLAADFRSLLPVFVVTLLLDRLPAPSAGQQQQHYQHHHNYGNDYPNPWSCFHTTHHFPLDVTGPACALPADSVGSV